MSRALLAVALVASLSLGSCAPWVYNTVTAVAINPNYMTTIKKFVGTEACAVDDTIFLADFTTCDFQFVEDVVDKAKTISPITCDRSCAQQWGVVSAACYHQFRDRMEGDRRFGSQATQFFDACDAKVKVHTSDPASPGGSSTGGSTTGGSTTGGSTTGGSTTGGSTTGGSSTGGSATGGSSTGGSGTGGSVAATDIDSATAPAPAEATADPPAAASPDTDLSGGIYVSPSMDESPSMGESPSMSESSGMDLSPSEPVGSPPMVDAEAGAEAPSADLAPGPGPAEAPSPAPAPVPAPAPAPVSSAAISNSIAAAAFALVGAALLLL